MSVLIYQSAGVHEKNKDFRECLCLQRAFKSLGIICEVTGPGFPIPELDNPSLVIVLENSDFSWLPRLELKCPKIIWAIDAHCHGPDRYEELASDIGCDMIFHATPQFVECKHHFWLPNCFCDELITMKHGVLKEYFLGFCGNYVNRKGFLDFVSEKYPIRRDIFVIGDDMVRAVNSYKIHVNKNISVDINYRTFETLGCGTVLLTDYSPYLSKLGFENHKNCLIYKSPEEAVALLDQYVNNNEAISEIAAAGFKLSQNHTYKKRAEYLAKLFKL